MRSLFTKYLLAASNLRTFVTSTNPIMSPALSEWAKRAIVDAENEFKDKPVVVDPGSNNNTANLQAIAIAKKFLSNAAPKFLDSPMAEDGDRLVKVGRSVSDLVLLAETDDTNDQLQQGLSHLVDHCEVLASGVKVPKVRFGRTELQMPIVSLGTMRFQQTWGGQITNMDDVNPKVQKNLVAILKHAICNLGISHVEAARGYGSSDFQVGYALKQLFDDGLVKREDLIVQTKVNPMKPADFRATIEKSLKMLQLDYVDLLSVHGLNMPSQYDQVFNNPNGENLIDILNEYKANGKIRHIGFSTHGQAEHIKRCINSDAFDYANIHFHAFGSYTASGGNTEGNKEVVKLMNEKDMGVFIISPNDKGGRLYAPSKKLRALTLPDLEPLQYGNLWLLNHGDLGEGSGKISTIVCGAARPSDLDEVTVAAQMYATKRSEMLEKVRNVTNRLRATEIEVLGEDWVNSWYEGLPNSFTVNDPYQFGQIVWLYNIIKAFGMLDFAKDRYGTFDSNLKKWDFDKPPKENIQKNIIGWGYMPGIAYEPGVDYSKYLSDVPEKNKAKVLEAIKFVHDLCSTSSKNSSIEIPEDWHTAYDMRPWTEFPMQKL